jgi:Ser/Thr protein kinase RdoA (MazF antagonist)
MQAAERRRAVAAAMSTASAAGLAVDNAVVLNDSNRLVVRLTPCDIVVRVTPITHHAGHHMSAEREVELVKRLAQTGSPVAGLDARVEPRVFARDGFKISMWTYFESAESRVLVPADYADRAVLASTLRDLKRSIVNRRIPGQLLHGEPHRWNVLNTTNGLLFMDFENTAYGPVEYDLAWAPKVVSDRYRDADQNLVGECRGLVLAMVAAYRWRRDDQHPSGRQSGVALLNVLRDGPPWPAVA